MRTFFVNLLVAVATFVIFCIGVEVFVRLTQTDGQNFDVEMWRYARELKRVSSIEGMGHEHVPNRSGTFMGVPVRINSAGWRDREYELEKPEGAVRIMMLGDSVTFGWGAPPEGVTSDLLEERFALASPSRPVEVLNTGIGNSNTDMQVSYFLAEGARYKPDIVVLNYFINDAEPTPERKSHWLFEHSYAAVFLAGRVDLLMRTYFGRESWFDYYRNLYGDNRPGWQKTRAAIARLADYCRTRGIGLLLVNYPELHQLAPYPFADLTKAIQTAAENNGVPFLDLTASVTSLEPNTLWVTKTDAHPNRKAAERFAEAIQAALDAHFGELLKPSRPKTP